MKIKRTEHFIQKPIYFNINCHVCNSIKTEWSEYEGHIWCVKCEDDIELKHKYDIYPVYCSELLGFDLRKWDMINKKIIYPINKP